MGVDNIMPTPFPLNDYIQAKSLLIELNRDPSKVLSLFAQAISDLNKPILFSVLLNDFIMSVADDYLKNINTIGIIFRCSIKYNNIYAFRLMLSLSRQDLILEHAIDLDKAETILMLAALYGSLDIFAMWFTNFMPKNINEQNTLGETVLHYAIKNNNHFKKEKTIDYLLQCGADQDLPYDETITVREKILQIKAIGRQKTNFIFCYQQYCLINANPTIYSLARLSCDPIKNIFRLLG